VNWNLHKYAQQELSATDKRLLHGVYSRHWNGQEDQHFRRKDIVADFRSKFGREMGGEQTIANQGSE
jgi:hypothetical protein